MHHHLVLLGVKVDVLEGTIIDPLVHFVNKFELVSLEIIAGQYLNDIILVDKGNNLLDHRKVSFDIVRHSKGAHCMHSTQLVNKCIIRGLERREVESQWRAGLPIINFKKNFNDVANVVLFIQSFTLLYIIGERSQDLANSSQVLNELFS